ncbi:MAG: NAD(P)/FAD-dependent oxidoreductase [Actinobacteria bacterium]|nr:NAD(P)/FAD-dependent oxidoreductase [Actinomycetota bacterium]
MNAEHFDVLIVGAGLSGIGAAYELQQNCPGKSYAILEMRDAIGGTWDIHRYPGIRSDSDMFTFGYKWRPWASTQTLADGPSILQYIRDTASEAGIDRNIRFGHKVMKGSWSTEEARWTLEAVDTATGETRQFTASFVYICSGYYRYDEGFIPDFKGIADYQGQILHPMNWPEDLDYAGKKVVIIGSGATAVTLVPAMADKAGHVTMLQRSPTYVASIPSRDPIARVSRRFLPEKQAYVLNRWKNILQQVVVYQLSQRQPRLMKRMFLGMVKRQLPEGYDIDKHFTPSYNPWDQRLCAVPDGDLFKAIKRGKASVVTDTIDSFTEHGIKLNSGEELEADIVVTATGFNLQMMGAAELEVDGEPVDLSSHMAYRGMMLEDIPNHAFTVGYTNSSWTLKADLVSDYVCRLLNYMDQQGYDVCVPRNTDPSVATRPLLDFGAGYVQRSLSALPKQGSKGPWKLSMSYPRDWYELPRAPMNDGVLQFSRHRPSPAAVERPVETVA